MYLYGSIEQVGTGTEMIVEKCIAQGLRSPDFKQDTENQYITIDDLVAVVGISASKIKENLSKLKAKCLIERIGPDKGGHWKILK